MFKKAPPSTIGAIAIDNDQVKLYRDVPLPVGWVLDISPRCRYVEKHNYIFNKYPGQMWYGSLSDDMLPITPHWDLALMNRAGSRGLAYANDLYTRRSGAFVVGGDLVRELGWIFNPKFVHYFGDTTMELIAREFRLAGLQEDIIVEHQHYGNKKNPGQYDQTSKDRPSLSQERRVFDRWQREEWPRLRTRLSNEIFQNGR